jgi:hypothetical protein
MGPRLRGDDEARILASRIARFIGQLIGPLIGRLIEL